MPRVIVGRRLWVSFAIVGLLALAACAPAPSPQPAKPAAEPAKPAAPAAAAPAKPAAEPAKPAAQPAKPAAQPAKPAAQPAKPAAQAAKPAAPVVELRAGCSNPKGDILCDGQDKFIELVSQKTNGEVLVRQHYTALGVEQQLTQAVMAGSVDIGMISNGNAGRFTSAWYVYDLPFLFKSYDAMLKSLDGPIGRKVIEQFEKDLGVKMFYVISYGQGRDIYTTKKPVKVPADLKAMKIRVVSTPIDLATLRAWGANPTPVDWAQTYTAMQQGVVEGANAPGAVGYYAMKHYEVAKYLVRLDYQAILETFFINARKFASLSPQHQKALTDAAQEAKVWQYKDAAGRVAKIFEEMKAKHGVQVYVPTAAEMTQWAAIREKVWQEVAEQEKGKIDLNLAKQLYEAQ
ncbi:MAG: TRAP transporter substrate-binding protein [Chloroflexi bacterium]|nr:TRAP transporter substrate-binding protein [Chloroflexota bacterium]